MKKYSVFLIALLLLAPCVWAQTFKRTAKNPGFFIPQGALQTGNKPEKLVPVEQMRFRGQQAPVVLEMQLQAQEKARKEAEEKAKQAALEKKKQEFENQERLPQAEPSEILTEEKSAASGELTDYVSNENIAEQKNTNVVNDENKKLSPMEAARIKAQKIKSEQNRQAATGEDEAKFAQIIEEYRREIKAISESKPLPNRRLIDVISDYKDVDRSI